MNTKNVRASWMGWALGCVLAGLGTTSCGVPTSFSCDHDNQCEGGQCIAGGCAFLSGDCTSGLQYGALSPEPLAGECVGVDEGVADESGSGEITTPDMDSHASESGESESDATDSGTVSSHPLILAHYSFDQIQQLYIFDSSGNDLHAEMENLQSSESAVVGEGLRFGPMDRVVVPADVLAEHTEFTVEFYMRITQAAEERQFLVYYGNMLYPEYTPTLTVYIEYALAPTQTPRAFWVDANDHLTPLFGTTNMFDGEWHHMAVTLDDILGMRLYVDHLLEDEDPSIRVYLDPNLEWIQIGGVASGFGGFSGVIDELRFSDRALRPSEMLPAP